MSFVAQDVLPGRKVLGASLGGKIFPSKFQPREATSLAAADHAARLVAFMMIG